jgi:hypothetical protein
VHQNQVRRAQRLPPRAHDGDERGAHGQDRKEEAGVDELQDAAELGTGGGRERHARHGLEQHVGMRARPVDQALQRLVRPAEKRAQVVARVAREHLVDRRRQDEEDL